MTGKKSISFLKFFVFINGASITTLEITASRILAPYFGASLAVWGSVIGITMVALALGYWLGGIAADKNPDFLVLGFLTLISGALAAMIPIIAKPLLSFLLNNLLEVNLVVIIGSLLGCLLLFALPILLMGMVSPFAARLALTEIKDSGQIVGSLYSLATLGSIIGVFLPSFILVPLLGSRETIIIFASIEILISLIAIGQKKIGFILLLPILALINLEQIFSQTLWQGESTYQYIQVKKRPSGLTVLKFNEGTGIQSIYDPKNELKTNRYWDYGVILPYLSKDKNDQELLMIGAAGATIATNIRRFAPEKNIKITGIEIDPTVIELAKKYFQVDDKVLQFHNRDGRIGLKQINKRFDLIYIDAYTNQLYIPAHLVTQEFFQETTDYLNPQGIVVANINAASRRSPLLQAIAFTMDSVYESVWLVQVPETYNYLVFASNQADPLSNLDLPDQLAEFEVIINQNKIKFADQGILLTDNRAPIDLLTDWEIYREWVRN